MIFKKISGSINSVPLSVYEELISTYVEKVSLVTGVKSIVQMGSFTTPGLSDIDLILIVDDKKPPNWEDISIKKRLFGENGFEVIAHDVFVYPEYLSRYIEGLFYIDQKTTLFGKEIGGYLPTNMAEELKLILTFEYTINRLEILVTMTSLPSVTIRDVLLFISTLRHTYTLLSNFSIISREECKLRIEKIEKLRFLSLDNISVEFKEELNNWIVPSFESIYESILLLGNRLNYEKRKPKKWTLNFKKLVFDIDITKNAVTFFYHNDKINKKFDGRILIEAMPSLVHNHIEKYKDSIICESDKFNNLDVMSLRHNLVIRHTKFIELTKYPLAKSYMIIENEKPRIQDRVKRTFLNVLSIFPIFK